ncbi:MAG: NAD(P)/FAD-dependent oxidoreductase [Acidobacteriota bacterium]
MPTHDLVVIGTGTAASTVASRCRTAGWTVAVIDSRPFGGTCALRGCDPKKVLVAAAEAADWAQRMNGKGVAGEARIDWPRLMEFKRTFTEPVPARRQASFEKQGIATFHGRAQFTGPTSISVGDDRLEGRHVLIAAGAKPADLRIPGGEHLTTSDQFLDLERLPARIFFVGGGYIAFEFAHVAARAGAEVTIAHRGARPLNAFDPDLVELLAVRTRSLGVALHLNTEVAGIDKAGKGFVVRATRDGEAVRFDADLVVHTAGRVPEIDDLELDAAGVKWSRRGVTVNAHLQSVSNPAVYAAGDAADSGGPPLTPVAGYEGRIVATNLLEGHTVTPDYSVVPSVVFTLPPLASVGLQEAAARERGLSFSTRHDDTASWFSSRRIGEEASGFKVLIEEGTGKVLGAHLLGPHAEEVINLFAVAMRSGMTAAQIKRLILAYPTSGSDIGYMV